MLEAPQAEGEMSEKWCPVCKGTGIVSSEKHNFLREQYLIFEKAGYAHALADTKTAIIAVLNANGSPSVGVAIIKAIEAMGEK